MYALSHNQSVVLDRESDQEKSLAPSGPRIRCALWLVAPQAEAWSVSTNKLLRYTIAESSNYGSCTFSLTLGCRLAFLVQKRRRKLGLVLVRFPELLPVRSTQRKSLHDSSGRPLPKQAKCLSERSR